MVVKEPIFVVGCPRSGTTLLQSILGHHPDICAFPESNALFYAAADLKLRSFGPETRHRHVRKQRLLGELNRRGWAAGRARRFRREMATFLQQMGADALTDSLPGRMLTMGAIFSCFDRVLSELADGRCWLEKSPKNLFILDYIDRYLPRARVLHVVRNGADNIASLRDAGLHHYDFQGDFGGPDGVRNALAQWNQALRVSCQWQGHVRHYLLRHEDLCEAPEASVRAICDFLGLRFDPGMLRYDPEQVSWSHEVWKRRTDTGIRPQPSRFATALSAEEQILVQREALAVDAYLPRRFHHGRNA
jgi:hypothetical protein